MRTTRMWLALDLRRRWRSLAVLTLLVALSSAVVLTAIAGARRGETALDRLAARTLPQTAMVLPNKVGFDWAKVRALPEVEALSEFALGTQIPIDGDAAPGDSVGFLPGDTQLGHSLERPVLSAGRMPDPNRADEAYVTPGFLTTFHKRLGDTVTMRLWTPEQAKALAGDDSADVGPPAGPVIPVRIVGVGRSVWTSGVWADGSDQDALLQPSYGVFARYRPNVFAEGVSFTNAHVRLRGGAAALPAFQEHLAQVSGRKDIDVWSNADLMARAQVSYSFQARSLLAFGLAALVASLFLVGQAMARYTMATVADLQVLRAVGMTPRQAAGAAACGPTLAALAGAILGVVAAAAASPWFPLGSAAGVEPHPGFDLDGLVLGLGGAAVPLAVAVASGATAWAALGRQRAAPRARPSVIATALARAGLPVPVVIGSRFALETGQGRTSVPVRPALFGAVAGVLGIVGAFTFSGGVADASSTPARFGQTWQLETFIGVNSQTGAPPDVVTKVFTTIAGVPGVSAVNDSKLDVAHAGNGAAVSLISYAPVERPLDVVLTAGRMPRTPDEVVLTPGSAAAVGMAVGGTVRFSAPLADRELTLVGTGFVPSSPHNDYNTGGWVLPATYANLFGDSFKFRLVQVALRPGADPGAMSERISAATAPVLGGQGLGFAPPALPPPIAQLRQVRILPVALGVFLVILAVGAVGHALATAMRRRRHDVAVLRALGMTRGQSRGIVVTQASVLTLVGLAFGVVLGVALGRTLWRVVADFTPLDYVPPLAFWVLVLVAPTALVVANLLAAWPGRMAARLRIGHVLRAE